MQNRACNFQHKCVTLYQNCFAQISASCHSKFNLYICVQYIFRLVLPRPMRPNLTSQTNVFPPPPPHTHTHANVARL